MSDYGVKIAKPTYDVNTALTDATKENFTILSTDSAHKVLTSGITSVSLNVAHGLGFAPLFDTYVNGSPANVWRNGWQISADATYLYLVNSSSSYPLSYVIFMEQA